MNSKNNSHFKNGGFPPLKYCKTQQALNENQEKNSKERFFSNAPRQNINIRQLLSDNKKKPILIVDEQVDNDLEIVDNI
jgi:hypothetical protein